MNTQINLNEMESGDLIENAVKDASPSASEESSVEKPEAQPAVKKDEKIEDEQKVPYSRFKEVNDELKRVKPAIEKLQELERMGYQLEDVITTLKTNPEEFSNIDVAKFKRELEEFKKSQAKVAEEIEFSKVLKEYPEAIAFEEEIKEIGRVKTNLTHKEIFEKYFKKAVSDEVKEKISKKEKSQVESGKGSGEEIISSMTPEQFSKLPLEKQREYLKKLGF